MQVLGTVRRKFIYALRNKPKPKEEPEAAPPSGNKAPGSASEKAIWYINKLFALEHIYSGEKPEYLENGIFRRRVKVREPLTPEEKKAERQRRSQAGTGGVLRMAGCRSAFVQGRP